MWAERDTAVMKSIQPSRYKETTGFLGAERTAADTTGGVTTFIYALADPAGEIRYIGKAINPHGRLRGHLCEARRSKRVNRRCAWLRHLLAEGQSPRLIILEECTGNGSVEEQFHIALARRDG